MHSANPSTTIHSAWNKGPPESHTPTPTHPLGRRLVRPSDTTIAPTPRIQRVNPGLSLAGLRRKLADVEEGLRGLQEYRAERQRAELEYNLACRTIVALDDFLYWKKLSDAQRAQLNEHHVYDFERLRQVESAYRTLSLCDTLAPQTKADTAAALEVWNHPAITPHHTLYADLACKIGPNWDDHPEPIRQTILARSAPSR
ncbi:hypothetical protein C8R44DRAFT_849611, partial [Mycena epipterygia]